MRFVLTTCFAEDGATSIPHTHAHDLLMNSEGGDDGSGGGGSFGLVGPLSDAALATAADPTADGADQPQASSPTQQNLSSHWKTAVLNAPPVLDEIEEHLQSSKETASTSWLKYTCTLGNDNDGSTYVSAAELIEKFGFDDVVSDILQPLLNEPSVAHAVLHVSPVVKEVEEMRLSGLGGGGGGSSSGGEQLLNPNGPGGAGPERYGVGLGGIGAPNRDNDEIPVQYPGQQYGGGIPQYGGAPMMHGQGQQYAGGGGMQRPPANAGGGGGGGSSGLNLRMRGNANLILRG